MSPNSQGTNRLIKQGAKLVECAEDVLEELEFSYLKKENKQVLDREIPSLFSEEREIFGLLKEEPVHIDSLIRESNLAASRVGELLMKLQIKGLVRELPGKLFVRDK